MIMRKIRTNKGFTLVEALFVVAIIVVLGSVIIMAIVDHMRSMEKTENDGYAKTIFVAAQNNLTMAEHEGYLGRTDFGYSDKTTAGVYYFRVDDKVSGFNNENSVLDLMLPFGSLDDSVRSGCYVIRYQKSSGKVLDVFYWKATGRYAFEYQDNDIYELMTAVKADPDNLRNYNGAVIGYYGGADAEQEPGEKIDAPQIRVYNDERLYVQVTRTISGPNEKINLAIRGETSGVIKQLMLLAEEDVHYDETKGCYEIVLDDVTDVNYHFSKINSWTGEGELIPGENITIYAVAYNNAVYTNVAYSSEQKTNSLFAEGSAPAEGGKVPETVTITNIRHLENLDPTISGFAAKDTLVQAVQSSDLSWDDFAKAINPDSPETVRVFDLSNHSSNKTGGFEPLNPNYPLSYDGRNHTISDVVVYSETSPAGLFGCPTSTLSISNLRLQDFSITGTSAAGALAASMIGGSVRNVLVCQSVDATEDSRITASTGYAGGLIGSFTETSLEACAAAVYVTSENGDAGGLVGKAAGGSIMGCYSAGYTEGGDYYKPSEDQPNVSEAIYSVTAAQNAGGLVADNSAKIEYCYSTCSVSGSVAGGFVGNGSKQPVKHSYCTGLVRGTEYNGAFAGQLANLNQAYEDNHFFSIINYGMDSVGLVGLDGSSTGMLPFDQSTGAYRDFVSTGAQDDERLPASPYDDTLVAYYQGLFNLRTVKQLGYSPVVESGSEEPMTAFVDTHYGDWPAPEILVVNIPNS